MSNTLVSPDTIAMESLRRLYMNMVMSGLVYRGYDKEFKKIGDQARIRQPVTFSANEFTPGVPITVQGITEGTVQIKLDTHLDVSFEYGSAEKALYLDEFSTRYIEPAMQAIAEAVDLKLCTLYQQIPTYYGPTLNQPQTKRSILQAKKMLEDQKCPRSPRYLVMDTATEAEYLEIFSDADKDASTKALREAQLGTRFGLDTYMDQQIVTHTPGTLDPAAGQTVQVNDNPAAAAATTINLKASGGVLTGTLKAGDLITIAGVAGSFCITELCTAAANVIAAKIYPALPAQVAQNTVVTLVGGQIGATGVTSYRNNLFFHRNAFCLATAPLELPDGAPWAKVVSYEGLSLRMVKAYDISLKKEVLSLDFLCGAKAIYPALAVRQIGNDT